MRDNRREFDQGRRFSPINVGDTFDVKIEAVGEKGDGIAKKNGFVIFVPKTKEGQEVKVKITKVMRNFGFAEVVTGESASDEESSSEEESDADAEETEEVEEESSSSQDSEDFGEDDESKF